MRKTTKKKTSRKKTTKRVQFPPGVEKTLKAVQKAERILVPRVQVPKAPKNPLLALIPVLQASADATEHIADAINRNNATVNALHERLTVMSDRVLAIAKALVPEHGGEVPS